MMTTPTNEEKIVEENEKYISPDADPPRLLHLHEVGLRRPLLALHAYRARLLQCSSIQEEFFRHGGLAWGRVGIIARVNTLSARRDTVDTVQGSPRT